MMSFFDQFIEIVIERRLLVIVLFFLLTAGFAVGVPQIDGESSIDQFETDSNEGDKLDLIEQEFGNNESTTTTQIIVRDDNVLVKESLLEQLAYQQALRENETVANHFDTNFDQAELVGVANGIARTAIDQSKRAELEARSTELTETATALETALKTIEHEQAANTTTQFEAAQDQSPLELSDDQYLSFAEAAELLRQAETEAEKQAAYERGTDGVLAAEYERLQNERAELEAGIEPTLDEQVEAIASLEPTEIDSITETVLSGDERPERLELLPTDYEPGTATANATILVATLEGDTGSIHPGNAPDAVVEAELAMASIADTHDSETSFRVFGDGITSDEIDASMKESLLIVAPFAFLFVLVVLLIAYRDLLDIALGLLGIIMVLVWTLGIMGLLGISFNQIFIAVPVLLIGLSIDYAIHVFMRHREELVDQGCDSADHMKRALAGVGIALLFVTLTTMIGFLSNLASPLDPIAEFGLVSAIGILAAFLIFSTFTPALKVELDKWFESYGYDRRKRAFGTSGGPTTRILSMGSRAARIAPYVVLISALVVSAGGVYGATQIDTSFQTEDFLADSPPGWTDELPDSLAPTNYTAAHSIEYLNNRFVRQDTTAEILIEGDVTANDTLERLQEAEKRAAGKDVTSETAAGEPAITSPLTVMHEVAGKNSTVNKTVSATDTTGNGIPDQDLEQVYDALYGADEGDVESVIARNDDDYEAIRLTIVVDGDADGGAITAQMRSVADVVDGDGLTGTATGQVIINSLTEDDLFGTVVQSLAVSLGAVSFILMAIYRRTDGSATLGAVTVLPVAFTVTLILGTMAVLDIPFNIVTGMITSITIGLGVAYSIHMTERYTLELEQTQSAWDAMGTSLTGTGGALFGSAATTAGGFGVLIVAFLPFLQEFGLITALMIIYAFLASVFILPSLLALWTRFAGPKWARESVESKRS